MAVTQVPLGNTVQKAYFFPAYCEAQVVAETSAAVLAHWIIPFDCEFLKVDYKLTVGGTAYTVTDFDLLVDGSSIRTADDDTMNSAAATFTGSITVGGGSTDVPPSKKLIAAGSCVTLVATTAADSTIDDVAACLVVLPT